MEVDYLMHKMNFNRRQYLLVKVIFNFCNVLLVATNLFCG